MNRRKRPNRRGIAPIEFLMILPTLALLFVLLVTIAAGGILCYRLTVEAREQAWATREAVDLHDTLSVEVPEALESLAEVFHPADRNQRVVSGRLYAEARRGLEEGTIPLVADNLPDATRRHSAFGGSWDHRDLPFEGGNGQRSRLKLDQRLRAFDAAIDLQAFRNLVPSS